MQLLLLIIETPCLSGVQPLGRFTGHFPFVVVPLTVNTFLSNWLWRKFIIIHDSEFTPVAPEMSDLTIFGITLSR